MEELIEIFPTAVVKFQLSNNSMESIFRNIDNEPCIPNTGNRTSTDSRVLDRPGLVEAKKELELIAWEYIKRVIIPINTSDISLYITQSWVNITNRFEFHPVHSHPNSVVSGVLYLNVGSDDSILFHREIPPLPIQIPSKEFTPFNSGMCKVPDLKNGDVIIFPSSLKHQVPVRPTDHGPRISLAFNTYVKGTIGSEELLTQVTL